MDGVNMLVMCDIKFCDFCMVSCRPSFTVHVCGCSNAWSTCLEWKSTSLQSGIGVLLSFSQHSFILWKWSPFNVCGSIFIDTGCDLEYPFLMCMTCISHGVLCVVVKSMPNWRSWSLWIDTVWCWNSALNSIEMSRELISGVSWLFYMSLSDAACAGSVKTSCCMWTVPLW